VEWKQLLRAVRSSAAVSSAEASPASQAGLQLQNF